MVRAQGELRGAMTGGPGKVVIDVGPDAPWCTGISSGTSGTVGDSIRFRR